MNNYIEPFEGVKKKNSRIIFIMLLLTIIYIQLHKSF